MSNPFDDRARTRREPARDLMSITPSDTTALPAGVLAIYAEGGGALSVVAAASARGLSYFAAGFLICPPHLEIG